MGGAPVGVERCPAPAQPTEKSFTVEDSRLESLPIYHDYGGPELYRF